MPKESVTPVTKDTDWLDDPTRPEWEQVRNYGVAETDGCTGVKDFYVDCCYLHDRAYRTGRGFDGEPISRREADARLRRCIQSRSRFGRLSPMSWWRWSAVRLFGGFLGYGEKK